MATLLVPHIGYDRAADIAKTAYTESKTVREIAIREALLPEALLKKLFHTHE